MSIILTVTISESLYHLFQKINLPIQIIELLITKCCTQSGNSVTFANQYRRPSYQNQLIHKNSISTSPSVVFQRTKVVLLVLSSRRSQYVGLEESCWSLMVRALKVVESNMEACDIKSRTISRAPPHPVSSQTWELWGGLDTQVTGFTFPFVMRLVGQLWWWRAQAVGYNIWWEGSGLSVRAWAPNMSV